MISKNNTDFNLSYHPPNPCLLLLPRIKYGFNPWGTDHTKAVPEFHTY